MNGPSAKVFALIYPFSCDPHSGIIENAAAFVDTDAVDAPVVDLVVVAVCSHGRGSAGGGGRGRCKVTSSMPEAAAVMVVVVPEIAVVVEVIVVVVVWWWYGRGDAGSTLRDCKALSFNVCCANK